MDKKYIVNPAIIKKIARKKNIEYDDITISPVKNKKYRIYKGNKIIDFGHPNYEDFTIHKDKQRRQNFKNRWKNNKYIYDKNSPLYYSYKLLW